MPSRTRDLFERLFGTAESGAPDDPAPTPTAPGAGTALALTGGGARAAYQAGVLRGLARAAPGFRPDLLTGVSAGGLNAAFLAASAHLPFDQATAGLVEIWHDLRAEHVFRLDRPGVAGTLARLVRRPAAPEPPAEGGFLDTTPLHAFVEGHLGPVGMPIARIGENLAAGHVRALAITATSYDTGRSVTWVEGGPPDMPGLVRARIRPEHVLASAALPFFFPAVSVAGGTGETDPGSAWYGDGGIRLTAPLSPALRLGADRILSVNTRAATSSVEPGDVYPPASRVLGVLMNAVFLDVLEQDARTLRRINDLVAGLPPAARGGFRPVDLLVIRPSEDLARLASGYEPQLPPSMRVALGRAGAGERSPDWLSMLLFDRDYVEHLVALGEADVEARADEIRAFLAPGASPAGRTGTSDRNAVTRGPTGPAGPTGSAAAD
ncbi:MAG TPA: patatin-like phospholipase family protein [Rubricoccaceae bacterium]|jgi:NTE family protein